MTTKLAAAYPHQLIRQLERKANNAELKLAAERRETQHWIGAAHRRADELAAERERNKTLVEALVELTLHLPKN